MSAEVEVDRLRSSIASLQAKIAREALRTSKARSDAARDRSSAARSTSTSIATSRLRSAERYEKTALTAERRRADLERQLATKMKALSSAETRLGHERSAQLRTLEDIERRMAPLELQFRPEPVPVERDRSQYDVFISYASEDRDEIAAPLAHRLQDLGLRVWFDEFALAVGDGLRRAIDTGLADSRFGVVIISPEFFRKHWPQAELDGLVARERAHGHKVVLPVWHRVTRDDVLAASPSLADKVALNTSLMTLDEIASSLSSVVRPDAAPPGTTPDAADLQTQVDTHVDEVRSAVARHGGMAVAVFGSVARGDSGPNSDIDFLVDFEEGRTLADLVALRADLQELLGRDVDVVSVGGLRSRDKDIPADAVWL